jgi:hypothetical protein
MASELVEWLESQAGLDDRYQQAADEIERLEDRLFMRGEMEKPPCFVCGYNGPDYYRPSVHKCAARHHKPRELEDSDGEKR